MRASILSFLLLGLCVLAATPVMPAPPAHEARPGASGVAATPTGRYIVKFRSGETTGEWPTRQSGAIAPEIRTLAARAAIPVVRSRPVAPRMHVLTLLTTPAADTHAQILARLRSDPALEWVEPDQRRYAHTLPNDTDYGAQWSLQPAVPPPGGTLISAIDAQDAWTTTTGSTGVVIGQLDTGVRFDHPDLLRAQSAGRLLPGYDFVGADPGSAPASYLGANDGDGWDPDPSDPGDWVSANDPILKLNSGCLPSGTTSTNSSWHGTRTAGILAALSNNATGVAGVTWSGWVLPVRVLGKCGGYDSDIIAGMQWAAGLTVVDDNNVAVPVNPYPAQILNMSLGGVSSCPAEYSDVITTLVARGVLVVASAGNEGGPVDAPANCPGVAGIAGLRQAGTKVGYSSLGPEVSLAAPAGNCGQSSSGACLYEIHTTYNLGTTVPGANGYTDQVVNPNLGTSFSAPLVAGTAALMLSVNGNLTAAQLIARLKEGTTAFPTSSADASTAPPVCHTPVDSSDIQDTECICTTAVCGAGMLNAPGAVHAALRPIAALSTGTTISAGQPLTLSGSGSAAACNHHIVSYAWTSGATTLGTGATVNVTVPASGATQVVLTVTDDQNLTDSVTLTLTPTSATAVSDSTGQAAPASAGASACPAAINPTGPAATLNLSAPTAAPVGQPITLTWSATQASSCEASGGASDGWLGSRAPSGTATVTEATPGSYTYGLTCYGATVSPTVQATVVVAYEPVLSLSASSASVQTGQSFNLTWSTTNATSCSTSGGGSGDGWTRSSVATSGTSAVSESSAGSYSYTLTCVNGPLSVKAVIKETVAAASGGGGGALDAATLAALAGLGLARLRRIRRP